MDTLVNVTSNGLQSNPDDVLSNIRGFSGSGDSVSVEKDKASVKVEETFRNTERKDRFSDLKELEDYFSALEEDRQNLQHLLQEQKEEHEMALNSLERQRIQERVEWETVMRGREEALQQTFLSMLVNREKWLRNIKNLTGNLSPPEALNEAKCTKNVATGSADITLQGASSNSVPKHIKESDLSKIAVLEERVKTAEIKIAKEAEKIEMDEEKKLESMVDALPGCTTQHANKESDRKETKKGFFRRLFSRKKIKASKPVTKQ